MRALRIEPLEQRRLLDAGGGAKSVWLSGTPPVNAAWFGTSVPALQNHVATLQAATSLNASPLAVASLPTPMPLAVSVPSAALVPSVVPVPSAVAAPTAARSDQWLVQLTPDAAQKAGSVSGAATVLGSGAFGSQVVSGLGMDGMVLVSPQAGADPKAVENWLSGNPNVVWYEQNAVVTVNRVPNDPGFPMQWDMQNAGQTGGTSGADINAPAAWDISSGSAKVVVGVIDTGVDYNHPDLYQNIWINQAEIPPSRKDNLVDIDGDGLITFRDLNNPINQGPFKITDVNRDGRIDAADILAPMQMIGVGAEEGGRDSGMGGWADGISEHGDPEHIDDLVGWNFVTNTNDPMDDYWHGTHVAGTIAAEGNNGEGVAGVNWSSSIMPLKFLNQYGWGWLSDAVRAVNYATMMRTDYGANVRVTSNSWAGGGYYQALYDAIAQSGKAGILFVAAAGNAAANNDIALSYPSSYDLDNIIAVAATDQNDNLAGFSSYGTTTVDLAAPGVSVLSTFPGDRYAWGSGTSMATPHVSGVAALAWSFTPEATAKQIRDAIFAGVDPLPSLAGKTVTGGRLNALGTLEQLGMHVTASDPPEGGIVARPPLDFTIHFAYSCDLKSVQASDFTVNGNAADQVALLSPDTAVFHFITSPVTEEGSQVMEVTAGSILRVTDGQGIAKWRGTFYYDTVALAVTSTTPGEDDLLTGPPTEIVMAFNEPILPTTVGPNDLVLSYGTVVSATLLDPQTVAFAITGVVDKGLVMYTLKGGAISDAHGTPGSAYVGHFNVAAPTIHRFPSKNVPISILDLATVTSTLEIPDSLTVTDLDVELDISHAWDSDLSAYLVAPDGTRVELFTGVGGSGHNFTGTVLDGQASTPIGSGYAPFTGRFQPMGDLSNMDGLNAQGNWRLEITDGVEGDVGTLNSWAILVGADVQGVPPSLRINKQQATATTGKALELPKIGTFSHPLVKAPFTYQINWDDGTDVDTGMATIVSPGSPGNSVVGSFGGKHVYAEAGTYYVIVTISDADDDSDTQTMQVVVNGASKVFPDSGSPLNVVHGTTPLPNNGQSTTDTIITKNRYTGPLPVLDDSAQVPIISTGGQTVSLTNSNTTDTPPQSVPTGVGTVLEVPQTNTGVTVFAPPSVTTTQGTTGSGPVGTDGEQDTTSGDAALLDAVRQALALPAGVPVSVGDWGRLTTLSADSNRVFSLTDLANAVNLQSLTLVPSNFTNPGHLTDLSPLNNLSNLKSVTLQRCGVTDAMLSSTSFPTLSGLQSLDLRYNNITTIPSAALSNLPSLATLFVYGTPLADSPQTGLASLAGKLLNVDLPSDHPEKAQTIADLADRLYNLPIKMYEYVLNTIEYQPYPGAMKGSLAVLETKQGNDWDTASLLKDLYGEAGISLNYANAKIIENKDAILRWLGATNAKGAYDILQYAGLEPVLYKVVSGTYTPLNADTQSAQTEYIAFYHTWLYRNAGGGLPEIYLDPSWKYRDLQPGVSAVSASVPFNDDRQADYLSTVRTDTPTDYYETAVRSYLAQNVPASTIADVAHDGAIHPVSITALPSAFPYDAQDGSSNESSSIPDNYLHKLRISVNVLLSGQTLSRTSYDSTHNLTRLTATTAVFESWMVGAPLLANINGVLQTLTIGGVPSSPTTYVDVKGSIFFFGNASFYPPGISCLEQTANLALQTMAIGNTDTGDYPALYLNGQTDSGRTSTLPIPNDTAPYYLTLERTHGNGTVTFPEPAENTRRFAGRAGEYIGVGLDVAQFSEAYLADLRSNLNDAELSKANGSTPSAEQLIGGLLELGLATYYNEFLQSKQVIAGLTGAIPVQVSSGLGIATSSVDDVADSGLRDATSKNVQFPYLPENVGFDLPQNIAQVIAIDGDMSQTLYRNRLVSDTMSSLESNVWEEITNMPAVSTMKIFEMAKQDSGNSFTTFQPNQGVVLTTITDFLDITDSTRETNIAQGILGFVQDGYSVEVHEKEVRIGQGDSSTQWHGVGYIVRKSENTYTFSDAFIIHGGVGSTLDAPHGGFGVWPAIQETPIQTTPTMSYTGDPINTSNGEVMHDETDVSIPNLGVPLSFARHYHSFNTQQSAYDRGMGDGWSFSFSDRLESSTDQQHPNDKIWFTDSGLRLKFTYNAGSYTNPPSLFGTFAQQGSNFVWTDKTGSKVVFDGSGRLYQVLDRYQDGLEISYVDSGTRIAEVQCVLGGYLVTDGSAAWLAFTYNSDSTPHVVAVSDSTGRTWSYSYNSDHRLVTVTAPLDPATGLVQVSYEYYPEDDVRQGLLKNVTDPNGGKTQYEYYANRRGMKVTDAEGNSHSISFNLYRDRTIFLDERQALTEYDHDSDGNVTQQINADQTTTVYTWLNGLKTSATDTFGQTEFYQYSNDGKGNLTQFTDRLGHSTVYTYSTTYSNLLTKTRQSDGLVTKYTYSDDGTTALDDGKSLWKLTNDYGGLGYITTYSYNWGSNRGLPNSIIKPKGYGTQNYKTTYTYNAAGQVTSQSTEDYASHWITTYFTYDSYGRGELVGTTDGKGASEGDPAHTTTYSYDLLGRRTKQALPDPDDGGPLPAPVTVYLYDASGNMLSTSLATASPQQTVDSVYDNMNRVTKIVNADGTYRTMQYDGAGNVIAQTDELGRVTRFIYDPRNRLVATILPDGTTVSSQYDGGGRTVATTDAQGNTTRFEYDTLGRKTAAILPYDDTTKAVTVDQNVSGSGWTTVSNSGGLNNNYGTTATTSDFTTWTFSLTAGHRYEVLVTWVGNTSNTSAASYAVYDGTVGGTLKGTVPVNQKIAPPCSTVFTDTGWLSLGRYYISGTTLTVKLTNSDGGNLIADAIRVIEVNQTSYAYDPQGNLQYVVNALGSGTSDTAHTTEYRYDKLGRQKAVIQPDADGNPSTQDRPITLTTYDADGNVASVVDARGASDDTLDAYGNPTGGTSNDAAHTTQYTYDQMDRKIMVTLPDPDGNGSLTSLYTWFYYDANSNLEYVVNANGANASRPDTFQSSADYTTEYVYDALNRKAQEILPDPDGAGNPLPRPVINYTFNTTGNLSSVTNPLGAVTRYGYDLRNRQTRVTDALGETTTTTLDAVGNVIFVTDALGRRTDFEYDVLNRKVRQTLPLPDGNTVDLSQTVWFYDANGNLTETIDPRGYTAWTIYDAWNRPVKDTDAAGAYAGDPNHTVTTTYDQLGRVIAVTDQLGRVAQYVYDNLGRKIETISPDPDDYRVTGGSNGSLNSAHTYFDYDTNGNLKYVTDALNTTGRGDTSHTTWYFYDTLNRQVCVIDPLGEDFSLPAPDSIDLSQQHRHSVVTTYDKLGNVTAVKQAVDASNYQTTTYQFDNLGRKTAEIAPDPGNSTHPTTQFVYDLAGNLIESIDPLNHATWIKYDVLNRVVRTVDARGSSPDDSHFAAQTVYDAVGKVESTTDPEGNTTGFTYDQLDRLVKETDPFWNDTQLWFDPAGNMTAKLDRDQRITQYSYDPLNREVEEDWNLPVTHTIAKTFNAAGELMGVSESDTNHATAATSYQYVYDQAGRMIRNRMAPGDLTQQAATPYTPSTIYTYDWDGDGFNEPYYPVSIALRAGDILQLTISSSTYAPAFVLQRPGGSSVSMFYENLSVPGTLTLKQTCDADGTWTIYVTTFDNIASGSFSPTLYYLVNPAVPTALVEQNYSYYADGSLQSASDSVSGETDYQYNGAGLMTQEMQHDPNNLGYVAPKRVDFTYNDAGQVLTETRYNATSQTNWVATSTSIYDGMGRLTDLDHSFDSTTRNYHYTLDAGSRVTNVTMPFDTVDFTNGYDAANQLVAADFNSQADESYTLDQNGNLTDTNWNTGAANRLITAPTSSGVVYTYTTDAEGNRTARFRDNNGNGVLDTGDTDVTLYSYDNRNRLIDALFATGYNGTVTKIVQIGYDYLGRQLVRALDSDGNGYWNEFRYNVYQGDQQVLEVYDSDGLGGGTAASLSHRDLYAAGVDQVLAVEDSSHAVRWTLPDIEGTVRDVVQLSGGAWTSTHRDYNSYGLVVNGTINTDMPYGYAGMWTDTATGMNVTISRIYDPQTQRWLTEDATVPSPDTNLYRYVGNNPWNVTDPTGMFGQLISTASSYLSSAWNSISGFGSGLSNTAPTVAIPQYQNYPSRTAFYDAKNAYATSFPTKDQRIAAYDNPVFIGANQHFEQIEDQQSRARFDSQQAARDTLQSQHYQQIAAEVEAAASLTDVLQTAYVAQAAYNQSPTAGDNYVAVAGQSWDNPSGLRAQLYQNTQTSAYVLAYKGTIPPHPGDLKTDALQGLGYETAQYDEAINIALLAKQQYGSNLSFTGHSLGGGLAAAASLVTHLPATTFNPAGVHINTVSPYGVTAAQMGTKNNITAYRVQGEFLTSYVNGVVGPSTNGQVVDLNGGRWSDYVVRAIKPPVGAAVVAVQRHLMDRVILGIQRRNRAP